MVEANGAGPGSVTIVVPAYDVERYLDECLASLRAQTVWDDCRVIVVDDGSTDATAAVAEAADRADPRIGLVRQPNSGPGPGAARNHGLDLVETEFVMFCDGDDELTPTAVEQLRSGLQRDGLDLAVGATEQFPEPRRWLWTPYFTPGAVESVSIEDVPLLAHNAATGNKMYRTAALRASGRRFAEGIHHQDTVVNVPAMVTSERLSLVGDVVHRYRKRPEGGSIMDSHFTRIGNYWDHLQVIETLGAELDSLPPTRRPLQEAFIARSFQGFTWRAPSVLPTERLEEFFRRTQAVVRLLSPSVITAATRDASERAAYVTMLEDDLDAFLSIGTRLDRLVARRGNLYVDLATTSTEHRDMLAIGSTRAQVDALAVDDDAVRLALSLSVRGARDLQHGLNGVVLRVQSDGDVVLARELRLHRVDPERSDFAADVTLSRARLARGRYLLRLGFRTPTGEAARWVRRPRTPSEPGRAGEAPFVADESVTHDDLVVVLRQDDGRAVLELV